MNHPVTWCIVAWVGLAPLSSAFWPFENADGIEQNLSRPAREVDPISSQADEVEKNDETVINTILRVVDHKFDTLSARITALERAVNGLQYYSVRQFGLLYSNSKSTNSQIQDISTRVSGLEIEVSRADLSGIKDKVTSIDNDVKMLFRQNNDMFEGMEQTLVVVNDNVNKGFFEMKTLLEKKLSEISMSSISKNRTLNYNDVTEATHRERDYDVSTSDGVVAPDHIKSSPHKVEIDTFALAKYFQKLENLFEHYHNQSALREAEYHTTVTTTQVPTTPTVPTIPIETVLEMAKEASNNLTVILRSVQSEVGDSVKFQRHAEHMLERLITNGESLTEQTIALSDNVVHLEGKIRDLEEQSSKSTVRVEELQSHSLLEAKRLAEKYVKSGQLSEECKIPASLRLQIGAIVSKNATHVFDQLTELTKLSTTSLPTTVLDLHDSISKMESMAREYSNLVAAAKADDFRKRALDEAETRLQIEEILNHSRAGINIMEAVSSNTGWLPLLLDTMDVIGMTANKSLAATSIVLDKVQEPAKIYIQSKSSSTSGHYTDATVTNGPTSGVTAVNLYNDKVEHIYKRMEKFNKFFPTITQLVSKSGVVLNLVDGSEAAEGRVELYNGRIWGSVCSKDFSDGVAWNMCTMMGFKGGHLAPSGMFSPGIGTVWSVDPDCLKIRASIDSTCVKNSFEANNPCSSSEHLGLVCHQMVRFVKVSRYGRGMIEVYFKGAWGGVCFDGWGDRDATVACRQLGYKFGEGMSAGQVNPSKPAWLTNMSCHGTETRLDLCKHPGWAWHRCLSNRLAGVQCR